MDAAVQKPESMKVLLVEDDPGVAYVVRQLIVAELGVETEIITDFESALSMLPFEQFDAAVFDYRLGDGDALVLLRRLSEYPAHLPVVIMTGQGDEHVAAEAFRLGASGYVIKDTDLKPNLLQALENALARARLERTQDALERQTSLLQTALDAMLDVFFVIDLEGRLIRWNTRVNEVLGFSDEELSRMSVDSGLSGVELEHAMQGIEAVRRNGYLSNFEESLRHATGEHRPYEFTASLLRDPAGEAIGICGIGRDVSERKRFEDELDSSLEKLRALTARIQAVREEERTLVARRIHDELGQSLTVLKIDLSFLLKKLPEGLDDIAEQITQMSSLVDDNMSLVRQIAVELRPGILDDLGLLAAIEWQAEEFQERTGTTCLVESNMEYRFLDPDASVGVFRIFQEALTNVARHAGATRVEISLSEQGRNLVLRVSDNGRGITRGQEGKIESLGILGMRERTHIMGGTLVIVGEPGSGTTVTVSVPLRS
jgi:two-component system, NarL family, sensor histidine kinase UhpB